MSYEVLARKWRPRRFEELVGQKHVVQALVNALDSNRVHHAFLFTGTRGVGKTTIARIVAKSLNCEKGVSAQPCGECSNCIEIDAGRFVDLIEVDAASRTKVDDTRELLDNVQYAPARGKYKVYLIDEVHMLSGHSFNALLKTLEEPPPHVKFLLATTDPQKLPVTVLSRCLQFNLKRIGIEDIADQLQRIVDSEKVAAEPAAIHLLARAADGSMRDGLSLLDQAIAFCAGSVKEDGVRDMLGTIDQQAISRALQSLAENDAEQLLHVIAEVIEQGKDGDDFLASLLLALHQISLAQVDHKLLDKELPGRDHLITLAQQFAAEEVQLLYQIGLMGRRDLAYAPDPQSGLEMILLRMLVFQPVSNDSLTAPQINPVKNSGKPKETSQAVTAKEESATFSAGASSDWASLLERMSLNGLLREMAINSSLEQQQDQQWSLILDDSCAQLYSKERQQELNKMINEICNKDIKLVIAVGKPTMETPAMIKKRIMDEQKQQAIEAINTDSNVQNLVEQLDAEVNVESIRPK